MCLAYCVCSSKTQDWNLGIRFFQSGVSAEQWSWMEFYYEKYLFQKQPILNHRTEPFLPNITMTAVWPMTSDDWLSTSRTWKAQNSVCVFFFTSCNISLSSMYFLAALLAPSACFLKASLEAMSEACWESRVARRRSNLQQTKHQCVITLNRLLISLL